MDFGLNRQIYYFHTQKSLERFIEQFKDTLLEMDELLYNYNEGRNCVDFFMLCNGKVGWQCWYKEKYEALGGCVVPFSLQRTE